jgi:gliding motility-associated-like protein
LQEIDYDLQVFDPPTADFKFVTDGCISNPVVFTDNSTNSSGRAVIHRYWNLDDGTIANNVTTITHKYATGRTYDVRYTLITDVGCKADTVLHPVILYELPIADFTTAGPYCMGRSVTFNQAATVAAGSSVAKWIWNFGDGSPAITVFTNADQVHIYLASGSYRVTLQVESDKGCVSTVISKDIQVTPVPEAKFTPPDICVSDLVAPFKDESGIAGGTITSWQWDFGDANATALNGNVSLTQNSTHHYSMPGDYTAQLITTSNAGCKDTTEHKFTVNGAVLTPVFNLQSVVQNGGAICSNEKIIIKDASQVDAGKIIRVEIFWDAADLTVKTIDSFPLSNKTYSHSYPEFVTPASKTYTIRYDVYSGITCVNSTRQTITLLATPAIAFDAFLPLCSNADPVQLAARIQNGLTGTGVFTGKGVSRTGLFNPQLAGEGLHILTYTFTASTGCVAVATKTVNIDPTPIANAGPDKVVLEGGSVAFTPSLITAYPVSYEWTPPRWLNNPSVANAETSPETDFNYTLTVTSDRGCRTTDNVFVKVLRTPVIPNIFSPNNDGIHDKWVIEHLDTYPGCVVQIYNRYGQMVHKIVNYTTPWDGRINGQNAPVGTYYYIIEPKNGRKPITGFVDIIR